MPENDIARLHVQSCIARVVTKAPRFSQSYWPIYKIRESICLCFTLIFTTLRDGPMHFLLETNASPPSPISYIGNISRDAVSD